MVQLGTLMYALLETVDGRSDPNELAGALTEKLGRRVEPVHVERLAQKLAAQGLLAGTEHRAPPRRNPLLALRWKVLVTNPTWTNRLTRPFIFLFAPWLMWPIVAAFAVVFWFVLIHKGVAAATAQAFHRPGLLLLVFGLAVLSAGFHELGHAAACRYGGATPGGMGVGLYLVWPAFYTDVTDTYRLPKRARLRVDLAGLYFNAVVAVLTLGVWLVWRSDALLLLVALQVLQMIKQLSPIIRADGYHILSDATGVPDLYSHMGPTLRRLLPGHRNEPSALTGRARLLVTVWVLIIVPVLISLMLGAVLLLPRLATTAWDSGRSIIDAAPHQAGHGQIVDLLASLVRLLALSLPVLGSALVSQRVVRTTVKRAREWGRGSTPRQTVLALAGAAALAGIAWAWWPSGQYQPVRANENGTLGGLVHLVSAPGNVARPAPVAQPISLAPGTHLAVAMVPVGGASKRHPAVLIIPGHNGGHAVEIVDPNPRNQSTTTGAPAVTTTTPTAAPPTGATGQTTPPTTTGAGPAAAFPFTLPSKPGPGGTQALAVGTKSGGVTYDVAYTLVTVGHGAPVTNTNSAYALADCNACTTVAVSFQVVLVIGQDKDVAPINAAGALNYDCPACMTTAIADQIVVTLTKQPSQAVLAKLEAALKQLGALPELGANGTPAAIAAQVAAVQQQVDSVLQSSGLLANPPSSNSTSSTGSGSTTTTTSAATNTTTVSPPVVQTQTDTTSAPATTTTTTPTSATTTTTPTTTTSTTETTTTTPPPSSATTTSAPTGTTG
jgi:putative peptide zinc metalloprotease protein